MNPATRRDLCHEIRTLAGTVTHGALMATVELSDRGPELVLSPWTDDLGGRLTHTPTRQFDANAYREQQIDQRLASVINGLRDLKTLVDHILEPEPTRSTP